MGSRATEQKPQELREKRPRINLKIFSHADQTATFLKTLWDDQEGDKWFVYLLSTYHRHTPKTLHIRSRCLMNITSPDQLINFKPIFQCWAGLYWKKSENSLKLYIKSNKTMETKHFISLWQTKYSKLLELISLLWSDMVKTSRQITFYWTSSKTQCYKKSNKNHVFYWI